jgi:hypothetical protein
MPDEMELVEATRDAKFSKLPETEVLSGLFAGLES